MGSNLYLLWFVNQNILLKNKIIRLKEDLIYLRSLSVECEIDILMSGESNFYIFSRCTDKFMECTNLMFAVSGDLISIQKLIIKQSYRNSYMNYRNSNTNDSIQSCSCCNII